MDGIKRIKKIPPIISMGRPAYVRGVKTRAVRLDQVSEDIVTEVAAKWGCNHSEAIRRIIHTFKKVFEELAIRERKEAEIRMAARAANRNPETGTFKKKPSRKSGEGKST